MDVDLIFRIAAIGMLTAILHMVLEKSGKQEYAYLTTLVGVIIVLGVVINLVSQLFTDVKVLFRLY
ncbi:stage III sporulation protein AC [Tissierella sp. Yu-01]|uniref:stage III sporulation protein AC n=1 Tax=Tissierella sp. Yu-01 TaxID=3035694 RepID=UPI00240DE76A|nr:stage III sporulation protein AC [Tissierella sp. Yu-01]WFA09690.1 stage III sporulation protein AC [Tissierella sp. Yu-01]